MEHIQDCEPPDAASRGIGSDKTVRKVYLGGGARNVTGNRDMPQALPLMKVCPYLISSLANVNDEMQKC